MRFTRGALATARHEECRARTSAMAGRMKKGEPHPNRDRRLAWHRIAPACPVPAGCGTLPTLESYEQSKRVRGCPAYLTTRQADAIAGFD